MNNVKISQFTQVNSINETTLIPIIQGSPLFNAIIKTDKFVEGLSPYFNNMYIKVDGTNSDLDILKFNTLIDNPNLNAGELAYNVTEGTLELGMNHGAVKQSLGLELYYHVKAAENIANGDLVEVYGTDGNSGKIVVRKAGLYAQPHTLIGIATEDISSNQNGFITWFGKLRGLNTTGSDVSENWYNGAKLYKHPTITGKLTMNKPTTGNKTQFATIINTHANNGNIFVNIVRSAPIGDLNDVNTAGATTLQPLVYNNGVWIPSFSVQLDNIQTKEGHLFVDGNIEANSAQLSNLNVVGGQITAEIIQSDSITAGQVTSTDGFVKGGSSNSKVLLGAGGDKPLSDFQMNNLTNDVITDAQSTTKYPTVKSIKDYADGLVAGLLDYRGGYDASSNVYPTSGGSGSGGAVLKGDMWVISNEGTLGGIVINAGDSIIASVDNPGQTTSNWNTVNSNLSYVPEDVANKSTDITNDTGSDVKYPTVKSVEDYSEKLANKSTSVTTDGSSNTKYPSVKAVKDYADTKVSKTGNETIDGIKTFNSSPIVPNPTTSGQAMNKGTADGAYVGKTGNETVAGVKTFSDKPIVPAGATGNEAVNANQVAAAVIAQMPAATNVIVPAIQYKTRVDADGGTIRNLKELNDLYTNNLKLATNTVWMWSGVGAYKPRTSGILTYASKVYDMVGSNDAVQATEANQPYLSGLIAPNEKVKLQFPEAHKWLTFGSPIEFASGSTWSVSIVFNHLYRDLGEEASIVNSTTTSTRISISNNSTIRLFNNAGNNYQFGFDRGLIANKNNYLIITSSGTEAIFNLNGVVIGTAAISGSSGFKFDGINNNSSRVFEGSISHIQFFNKKLEADEVNKHYEYIKSLIPEIEGIAVGNQFWATSNFDGVLVRLVPGAIGTVASNGYLIDKTEYLASNSPQLITNGDFSNGLTGWSLSAGSEFDSINQTIIIKDGVWFGGIATTGVNNVFKRGKTYKLEFDVVSFDPGNTYVVMVNSSHVYINGCTPVVGRAVHYFKSTSSGIIRICAGGANQNIVITNISVKEAGADESTLAYNEVYNRAVTYANNSVRNFFALQTAAMWCYYDNNPDNWIYGKMYNWYAAELFGLYGPKNWIVPRNENWSQLQTYLGGSSVGGKKAKALFAGFNNANANNETGLSMIPTGGRNQLGVFAELSSMGYYHTRDNYFAQFMHNNDTFQIYGTVKEYFIGLRLMREIPVGDNERKVVGDYSFTDFGAGFNIPVPFGYNVKNIKVVNKQLSTNITSLQAVLYNSANVSQGTLITGKTVNGNSTMMFNTANLEIAPLMSDGYVRITGALTNNAGGAEITLVLEKVLI